MKPELTMSNRKNPVSDGPVIITQGVAPATETRRKSQTKKNLIIGVSVILVVALVLTAILVGMYLFTRAHTDLIKYSLNVDKDTKQDVAVDRDDNSVEFHSYNDKYETWTVNDFNKDIHTVKVKTSSGTNCYISPLNRTSAMDPFRIENIPDHPSDFNQTNASRVNYVISGTPVADASFLGKKARDLCKGTSVYWTYTKCSGPGAKELQRSRRAAKLEQIEELTVYDCYPVAHGICTCSCGYSAPCTLYDCYPR